ncbi:hypothetical protein J6590_097469 [Homalodisca vitripennis]|nr:hypothetical protein J6590_097469 [Homalodisca vitripennis]
MYISTEPWNTTVERNAWEVNVVSLEHYSGEERLGGQRDVYGLYLFEPWNTTVVRNAWEVNAVQHGVLCCICLKHLKLSLTDITHTHHADLPGAQTDTTHTHHVDLPGVPHHCSVPRLKQIQPIHITLTSQAFLTIQPIHITLTSQAFLTTVVFQGSNRYNPTHHVEPPRRVPHHCSVPRLKRIQPIHTTLTSQAFLTTVVFQGSNRYNPTHHVESPWRYSPPVC